MRHPRDEPQEGIESEISAFVAEEEEHEILTFLKESRSFHSTMKKNPFIIDSDDINTNKPNTQEMKPEDPIYLPIIQQPLATTSLEHSKQNQPSPAMPDRHGKTTEPGAPGEVPTSTEATSKPEKPGLPFKPSLLDDQSKSEGRWRMMADQNPQHKSKGGRRKEASQDQPTNHQNQPTVVEYRTTLSQEDLNNKSSPANSTPPTDLSFLRQDCGEIQTINDDRHPEGKMAKCLTENCKGQRPEHRGMTRHDGKLLDKYKIRYNRLQQMVGAVQHAEIKNPQYFPSLSVSTSKTARSQTVETMAQTVKGP